MQRLGSFQATPCQSPNQSSPGPCPSHDDPIGRKGHLRVYPWIPPQKGKVSQKPDDFWEARGTSKLNASSRYSPMYLKSGLMPLDSINASNFVDMPEGQRGIWCSDPIKASQLSALNFTSHRQKCPKDSRRKDSRYDRCCRHCLIC